VISSDSVCVRNPTGARDRRSGRGRTRAPQKSAGCTPCRPRRAPRPAPPLRCR